MDKKEKHNCEWCNNEYEITHHNHLWRKRNNVPNVCNDCMKKHRSQKASEHLFKYWNNMSAEDYDRICQERSDKYASLSQEEKDKQKKQLHESYMNWYENICDKEEWRKMCSEHSRLFWDNITDEERKEKVQKHSEWHKSLTPEERAELIYKQTRWIKELSEEEKKKIYLKLAIAKEKSEYITICEFEFSNILNKNNINYQFQYQTDDLDAWIIKAYSDKIEDNTPVINIKTNEEIKFKDFINILLFDNLSDNEKKELINKKI